MKNNIRKATISMILVLALAVSMCAARPTNVYAATSTTGYPTAHTLVIYRTSQVVHTSVSYTKSMPYAFVYNYTTLYSGDTVIMGLATKNGTYVTRTVSFDSSTTAVYKNVAYTISVESGTLLYMKSYLSENSKSTSITISYGAAA